MLIRSILLFLLLVSTATAQTQYSVPPASPSGSQGGSQNPAKPGCPWLTRGTAARALGTDVSATVTMANTLEGACRFSAEPGSPDYLEIQVSKAVLPGCPAGSPELKGIGNQATRCVPPGSRGHGIEMVSSRVRDLCFTVTLSLRGQKNTAKSTDGQNDALEQIAEQVAGSLY
jgi:hypothetical protein